jgi:two-component system, OmpR family, response regulator
VSPVARLLVVDARGDRERLRDDLAARGVHVTWAGSTLDGLVEFGRTEPTAVIIAPDAPGGVARIRRIRGGGYSLTLP